MSEAEARNTRGLIKSMMIIGSAQSLKILLSIVRLKALAILLGPSGVGLLSIYNSLQSMAQQAAGLGMGSSGVREIAASRASETTLSLVRRVLLAAHFVQGGLAMVAIWLLRAPIANWLFGDTSRATAVGLIGVAVLLALLGTAQTALLQGFRQIANLGRVTVIAAFLGTFAGLFAVWVEGEDGLIWFVLVQPIATMLVAHFFARRLPKPTTPRLSLAEIWQAWKPMAKLGAAFMLGGLATTAILLLVRGRIAQELGLDAAGHFAAAWGMTMTYVGFLLSAMAADYYPRLTEVIHDRAAAIAMMNDQAQLGLAIGGPVLLLLIGLAPWIITLLYSAEFEPAVTLLQWQTIGNVFKLASWALSFSIVAAARAKTFFFTELSFNIVFLGMVLILLPQLGLEVTAYAFVLGYAAYLATVYGVVRRIHGFRFQPLSLGLLCLHAGLAAILLTLALTTPPELAGALSIVFAGTTALSGLRIVLIKIGPTNPTAIRLSRAYTAIGWPIREPK